MSASTQTLQRPRRIGTSAILVLVAILLGFAAIVAVAPRAVDRTPTAVPAPAVSVPARLGPGSAAADRQAGPAVAEAIRPTELRDGSVKIGSSAGFVPPHGSGDFRGTTARGGYTGAVTAESGPTGPIQVGGFTCHQCR